MSAEGLHIFGYLVAKNIEITFLLTSLESLIVCEILPVTPSFSRSLFRLFDGWPVTLNLFQKPPACDPENCLKASHDCTQKKIDQ
jgi:hypothetical protein